jgi:hypothetical protein
VISGLRRGATHQHLLSMGYIEERAGCLRWVINGNGALAFDVGFTLNIRHSFDSSARQFRATSQQRAAQQTTFYSTTLVGGGQLWSAPTRLRYSARFAEPRVQSAGYADASRPQKDREHVRLPSQRSQDVRSFSSIEKIAPASILMPRTMQTRPVTSVSLTS